MQFLILDRISIDSKKEVRNPIAVVVLQNGKLGLLTDKNGVDYRALISFLNKKEVKDWEFGDETSREYLLKTYNKLDPEYLRVLSEKLMIPFVTRLVGNYKITKLKEAAHYLWNKYIGRKPPKDFTIIDEKSQVIKR